MTTTTTTTQPPQAEDIIRQGSLPPALMQNMKLYMDERAALDAFIVSHFTKGTDFGSIKIKGTDTKSMLFKAGAEQIIRMVGMIARFLPDDAMWQQNGSKPGTVCLICHLLSSDGEIMGEGRGSSVVDDRNDINKAVKMAEKRAMTDSVLRTFALTGTFADEDFRAEIERDHADAVPTKPQHVPGERQRAQQPEPTGKDPERARARQALNAAMKKMGVTPEQLQEMRARAFLDKDPLDTADFGTLTDMVLEEIPF